MQKTTTFLMFVGEQCGKAEEAINFYISLFKDSAIQSIEHYKANEPGGKEGTVKLASFTLAGQTYMAIDSAGGHKFSFTPAISIYVNCESEEETENLYNSFTDGGSVLMPLGDYGFSKKFGWVADRYGVSWQLNWV
jgi:predicted 3-demethylubiquinone-9 3-methyltransferase (glyoxalase superfamily)